MDCPDCGQSMKTAAGLASHQRSKHPEGAVGDNVRAIGETLEALELAGRLEKVDEAKVQAVRSMAAALDTNPHNAQMWREYGEALERLTDDGDSDDGTVANLLRDLSPEVRDTSSS